MAPPVELTDLTFSYGKHRGIADLTLAIRDGEVFGFLGPNGAGKTTTIRTLMGLLRPSAGSARVFGLDCWRDAPAVKARIGFLPGDIRLYERLTCAEFLDFFAAFRPGAPPRRRALAERLKLDLGQQIKHLSKGNRQKLALVQALMHDAPLLVLDEPSSGLDPLNQEELLALLREEQARGKTIFLSSHQLPEVEQVAQRAAIIREGRLVAVEDVAQLKAQRERRMEVALRVSVDPGRFANLAGVRVIAAAPDENQFTLAVRGEPGPLLRLLAELPVADFTFGPPDLEDVFLHYYSAEATTAEAQAAVPAARGVAL
jgi:ABC-2 type transport system ATP-binding protein